MSEHWTALLWSRPRSLSQLAGGGGGPCTSEEVESEFSIPKLFLHGGLLLMLRESLLQTGRRKEVRTESGVEPDVATAMARESASISGCSEINGSDPPCRDPPCPPRSTAGNGTG